MPPSLRAGLFLLPLVLPLAPLPAQTVQDSQPVDTKSILQALGKISDTQAAALKALKQTAYQEAAAAAGNPARATELWEEAVRVIQFQGLSRESTQFHEWKTGEGEAMKEREVQSALHLYFQWLALTLQRSNGATAHDLYASVLTHAHEVVADQALMDAFNEEVQHDKDTARPTAPGAKGRPNEREKKERANTQSVKKLHDQILSGSVSNGLYAQAIRLTDAIVDVAPVRKGRNQSPGDSVESWESSPGNLDGIYQQILLPEMRVRKDPRVVEYWDGKLSREATLATQAKLSFTADKFNTERRPQLLWSRAREFSNIGLKNRAATEMFNVIKSFPAHPDAPSWIAELTTLLAPPAPVVVAEPLPGSTASSAPAAPPAAPVAPR